MIRMNESCDRGTKEPQIMMLIFLQPSQLHLKILKCYCTIRDIDAMIPNAISMILPTSLFSTKCRRCLIVSKFSTKRTSIIACPNWILMLLDLYLNVVLTTQRVACIAVARGVSTNCPTVVTFCGGFECNITRNN